MDVDELVRRLAERPDGVCFGDGDEEFLHYCASGGLAWRTFLAEYGRSWDGTPLLWPTFREWFLHHASNHGFDAEATAFTGDVDGHPDRAVRYGITIQPPPAPVAAVSTECPYDELLWAAFLDEHGARWSGSAQHWRAFRTIFLHGARELGLEIPATAFIEYVEQQPDKRVVFEQYLLAIPAPAETPEPVAEPAAAKVAVAEPAAVAEPIAVVEPAAAVAPKKPTRPRTRKAPARVKEAKEPVEAVAAVSGAARPPRARSSTRRKAA